MTMQRIEYQGKQYDYDEISLRLFRVADGSEIQNTLDKIHIVTYATEISPGSYYDIGTIRNR